MAPPHPPPPPPTTPLQDRLRSWWKIITAIAYELKPFSLPTKHDLINTIQSTRVILVALWADLCSVSKALHPTLMTAFHSLTLRQACIGVSWCLLFLLFIHLEFGVVFFLLSSMGALYVSTGDTRGLGQSAWSVFNEGFRPLLGTLDADQIDRAMRHQADLPEAKEEQEDGWELVHNEEEEQEEEEEKGDRVRGSRKSGKKARRNYNKEERQRKRDAALARQLQAAADDEGWESD